MTADEYVEKHYAETHPPGDSHRLAAKMGFEAGRKAGLEEAAKIADSYKGAVYGKRLAEDIRQLIPLGSKL